MIVKQQSDTNGGIANHDLGTTWTRTINFAPARVHAQVCLHHFAGDGNMFAGIKGYHFRSNPKGAEQKVDLGPSGFSLWPSIVGPVDNMTGITWGVYVSEPGQEAYGRLDMYWWS